MFVVDWFYSALSYFGLYKKNAKILFLGLDNAGKTTLMHMLTHDKLGVHAPTTHPGQEELVIGSVRFKAFDLGGHETARRLWDSYFPQVDAVIYLVDSMDRERFPEAKRELDGLLSTDLLATTPFLILGNKIDIPRAANESELKASLGLEGICTGKELTSIPKESGTRPIEVFMCSIIKKQGYPEGFKWITNFL